MLRKGQNLEALRHSSLQICIDKVTFPLSLAVKYEEVEKGSTNETFKNMILPLMVSSADTILKIVLWKGHVGEHNIKKTEKAITLSFK